MHFRTAILSLLALPILTGQASALERAELIPDNLFYLQVDNVHETWSALNKLFIGTMRNDEQYQQFAAAFETKLTRSDPEGDVSGIFRFLQIFGPALHGELVAGVSGKDTDQRSHSYLVAAMPKDLYEESLTKGKWVFEQTQAPIEMVKSIFQNHQIIQLITDKGTNGISKCWISHLDDTLLISSDQVWMEQSMVTLNSNPIEEPTGKAVAGRLPLRRWMRSSLEKTPEPKQQNIKTLLATLGILGIEQYRFEVLLEEDGLLWNGNLEVDSLSAGLFALLDTTPLSSINPHLLPDNASSFYCTHVDLTGFWNKLPEMAANLPNGVAGSLNMLESALQQQTGISLEHDLFEHAGEILTTWTETIGTNQHLTATLSLKDGTALQNTLDRFLGSPMGAALTRGMKTETFRDRFIYSFYKSSSSDPAVNLCITDNFLVLTGSQPDPIHDFIQRLDSSIERKICPIAETSRHFAPGSAYSIGATDHQEAVSYLIARLSDTGFSLNAEISSRPKQKKAKGADLAENEISFNYVSAFLGNSYNYAETTEQGIHHQIMFKYNETEGAH